MSDVIKETSFDENVIENLSEKSSAVRRTPRLNRDDREQHLPANP
ncbi:hypothetical protein RSSM_04518 [Rhodopirellula sallentina SM41]|uniref:Uncharacterized protein n=1 Tax=Rhodopirellula sallentina SM41 TaxID=1263870 RepID=M5UDG2_9BACT|nr:hypothetical protein RSSM_04518 [Rhodopirellula sallentina SM41]